MQNINDMEPRQSAVTVDEAGVMIERIYTTDPATVEIVRNADNRVEAVRHCLEVGARASQLVQTNIDSAIIEKQFEEMTRCFDESLEGAVRTVNEATMGLVGDEGSVRQHLEQWREGLDRALGDAFDPASKASVISKIEAVLVEVSEAQKAELSKLVDPSVKDSPLNVLKADIEQVLHREVGDVQKTLLDLAERVAARQARDEVMELTTQKGFAFEDLIHDVVCRVAAQHGDLAEVVGTSVGSAGTKAGDEVVHVNEDDTFGASERFVLEAKDRSLGATETHRQLDAAMQNRDAKAAIAVFSSQGKAPTSVPFSYAGLKAVVVLDKSDPDTRCLELAYLWARWVVRRQLADNVDGVDVEAIEAALAEASRALTKLTQIKGAHTAAAKQIARANELARELASDVDTAIEAIRAEIVR